MQLFADATQCQVLFDGEKPKDHDQYIVDQSQQLGRMFLGFALFFVSHRAQLSCLFAHDARGDEESVWIRVNATRECRRHVHKTIGE